MDPSEFYFVVDSTNRVKGLTQKKIDRSFDSIQSFNFGFDHERLKSNKELT